MKEKNKKYPYYSEMHKELIDALDKSESLKRVKISDYGNFKSDFIKNYSFEYGSWPLIISKKRVAELNSFFQKFKTICYKAVTNYLTSKEDFNDYFNYPTFMLDILRESPLEINDHIFRHDIIYSQDTFKVLEVNAGSSLGGWQLDWLKDNYIKLFRNHDFTKSWNVDKEEIVKNIFRFIMYRVSSSESTQMGHHILFFMESEPCGGKEEFESIKIEFSKIFNEIKAELVFPGELIWATSMSEIQIDKQKVAYAHGVKLGGVMLNITEPDKLEQSKILQLTQSFLNGNLIFPDSPFHTLLGHKNFFALLHDAVNSNILNEDESLLIKKHIPWTYQAGYEHIMRNHVKHQTLEFALRNKDHLVLKKSLSAQGKDVFIGRYMSAYEWQVSVENHITDKEWLIQEYCIPEPALMCDQNGWLGEYHFVWGVFDVDSSYSGAFVRGTRVESGDGVINSANGAHEFCVFEEKKLKRMITI